MTLARQMYPSNPHELTRHFEDAVSKRYGYMYLLVDLKADTPDHLRMRANVLTAREAIREPESINSELLNYPNAQIENINNERIRTPSEVIRAMSTTATQTDISDRIGRVGHGAFVESQNIVDKMEASGRNVDDDDLHPATCARRYTLHTPI